MKIPIFNSLYLNSLKPLKTKNIDFTKLNNLNFIHTNKTNFPLLNLIKRIPIRDSLFETVIVSANDYLVKLFLEKKIKFTEISKILLKVTNMKKLISLKKKIPKNTSDIVNTKNLTVKLLNHIYIN